MKRVIDITIIILMFFITYFLQISFFTYFNIAGIKPNIFVIFIMILGLYLKKDYGFFFGVLLGLLLDFFIGPRIGINTIALSVTGFISGLLDKNFSKDNRITVILITAALTLTFETIVFFLTLLYTEIGNIQILQFIKIVLIEALYNILLVIIFYPGLIKIGQKLEEDFEVNSSFLNYL